MPDLFFGLAEIASVKWDTIATIGLNWTICAGENSQLINSPFGLNYCPISET